MSGGIISTGLLLPLTSGWFLNRAVALTRTRFATQSFSWSIFPAFGAAARMYAYIYRSNRKTDTYLYLASRDGFDVVPQALRASLGKLEHVMDLELTPTRKLALADPQQVRKQLAGVGYYLQYQPGTTGLVQFNASLADE